MRFDKSAILALDDEQLSPAEKRYLIAKFFPKEPRAPWQESLRTQWLDSQRWERYLGSDLGEAGAGPYRYTHAHLMEVGQFQRVERVGTTVSDFAGWIYSLY